MRIALCGALGKMGREVYEYCQNVSDIDVVSLVDKRFYDTDLNKDVSQNQRSVDTNSHKNTSQKQRLFDNEFCTDTMDINAFCNGADGGVEAVSDINDALCDFDAIIDFSAHKATISILKVAIVRRCAVVLATTGHDEDEKKYIEYASRFIPVFYAGNMSLGIAAMAKCVRETLSVFNRTDTTRIGTPYESAHCICIEDTVIGGASRNDNKNRIGNHNDVKGIDVEIIETHHTQKSDVPSGTALMLADVVKQTIGGQIVVGRHENGKKKDGDIGVHSLRMGSVFGKHEVRINTGEETLTFTHEALSRKVYAKGAIEAVRFVEKQSAGIYGMDDLL